MPSGYALNWKKKHTCMVCMHVCKTFEMIGRDLALCAYGVSTQLQSSGLVAHENSTFRNLALAVSGLFMA